MPIREITERYHDFSQRGEWAGGFTNTAWNTARKEAQEYTSKHVFAVKLVRIWHNQTPGEMLEGQQVVIYRGGILVHQEGEEPRGEK